MVNYGESCTRFFKYQGVVTKCRAGRSDISLMTLPGYANKCLIQPTHNRDCSLVQFLKRPSARWTARPVSACWVLGRE